MLTIRPFDNLKSLFFGKFLSPVRPRLSFAPSRIVMHSEAETLSFVMVGTNHEMHATAKRCTGFGRKYHHMFPQKQKIAPNG